jgi:DNA-binding NarL/FixJ family response regulator
MSIKILLADDHRITREGVRSLLNDQPDLKVIAETGNGRAAVELATEAPPDVVVMDVTMPELNGVEATRQIKAHNPKVNVLALSMHVERQFVSEMLAAGASGYILKDCPTEELVRAIRTVAGGTTYLSPKVQDVLVKGYVSQDNAAPLAQSPWGEPITPAEPGGYGTAPRSPVTGVSDGTYSSDVTSTGTPSPSPASKANPPNCSSSPSASSDTRRPITWTA